MPRIARIIAPGYPHHVTQRGNNRATVFFDDEDRQTYIKLLSLYAKKYKFKILAYCLMDNHIHLLVIPETELSLARGIGLANMLYTQYINRKFHQSGRIWQNRFFSCVVEGNDYLWTVARYIERNPVKAGICEIAEAYRWSSARAHILGQADSLLAPESWLAEDERNSYAAFASIQDDDADNAVRQATRSGRLLGSKDFVDLLERQTNQVLQPRRAGRPRKVVKADKRLYGAGFMYKARRKYEKCPQLRGTEVLW